MQPIFSDHSPQEISLPEIGNPQESHVQSSSFYKRLINFKQYVNQLFTSNRRNFSIELSNQRSLDKSEVDLDHLKEMIKGVEKGLAESGDIDLVAGMIQNWIVDFTLKGGAFYFEHGMPFMLAKMNIFSSASNLPHFEQAFGWIRVVTDLIDTGTGTIGIYHRKKILNAMQEKIAELQLQQASLQPEQVERLERLTQLVNYENSALSSQIKLQTAKSTRNYLSMTSFSLSWLSQSSIITTIIHSLGIISSGIGTVLSGIDFYSSSKSLNTQRHWSRYFTNWVKSTSLFFIGEKMSEARQQSKIAQHLKSKRKQRDQAHIKLLKETPEKMNQVYDKVHKIKSSGLQLFLERLNLQELSESQLQAKLEEKLGCALDSNHIQGIKNAYIEYLNQIKKTENLSAAEKQERLIPAKKEIEQYVGKCVTIWMNTQSQDSLLSTYIDYQAVLDTTIKSSLIEMVKTKFREVSNFLTVKRNIAGISFTISSAIFSVGLTLFIIGLVANPIGAAALIMVLLFASSITIGLGLMGAGYYYAHREQPQLTSAILKGAYLRLFSYYITARIYSIKESIGSYLEHAWQHRRERLAATSTGQFPLYSSSSMESARQLSIENIEQDFQRTQLKSEYWRNKAVALEKEFEELAWKDFAKKSDLKATTPVDPFDTLEALSEALSHCDLAVLDSDTIEFLQDELGINIHKLQKEVEKDPERVKNILKQFFSMSAGGMMQFITLETE